MTIEERASGFVERADAALSDLGRAAEIWTETIRSNNDEIRLHSLSVDLDTAMRKVDGQFKAWNTVDPSQVKVVAQDAPINVLWALSAHRSGRVREAFLYAAEHLSNDLVLPHIANRSIDFVDEIRQVACPMVEGRLEQLLTERVASGDDGALSTEAHIVAKKLLIPRTAIVSPQLIGPCMALAETTTVSRPGSYNADNLDRILERCRQTLTATSDPVSTAAIQTLVKFYNDNAIVRQPKVRQDAS